MEFSVGVDSLVNVYRSGIKISETKRVGRYRFPAITIGKDCVKRNALDSIAQLMSAQEEKTTNQNQIVAQLHKIMTTMDTIYKDFNRMRQLGGHRTDSSGANLRNFIARKTHESVGDIGKNQTMGAVGSQREIGPDARNLGLELKPDLAKKEHSYISHTTCLAAVNEMVLGRVHLPKAFFGIYIRVESFSDGGSKIRNF